MLLVSFTQICGSATTTNVNSGQIYWTAVYAPKRSKRVLSYIVGWFTAAAYFFGACATILITAQILIALVSSLHVEFVALPWHYYVVYLGFGVIAFLVNIPLIKIYPYYMKMPLIVTNIGALFIFITLLVRVTPKQSASYVFLDIVNYTGWSSTGVVFMMGLLPGVTAVTCFDAAAHMTDEIPDPQRRVPQVMIYSSLMGAVLGLPMVLVEMFCTANPANLLTPVGGQPIVQLMYDSFNSVPLFVLGCLVFILVFLSGSAALLTTFSRIWWSLAREGGTPFPKFMTRIDSYYHLPVNSIVFCTILCLIIGAIQLGSSTAINAILGSFVICLLISYAITLVCLVLDKRRSMEGVPRYINLGKWGWAVDIIAAVWCMFIPIWLMFPLYLPVTGTTLNYSVAVCAAVVLVSGINWFAYSRKTFVDVENFSIGHTTIDGVVLSTPTGSDV